MRTAKTTERFDIRKPGPHGESYVILKDNLYLMKPQELKSFLRMCSHKVRPRGIYAVKAGFLYQMTNIPTKTREEFREQYQQFTSKGFSVLHTCAEWSKMDENK